MQSTSPCVSPVVGAISTESEDPPSPPQRPHLISSHHTPSMLPQSFHQASSTKPYHPICPRLPPPLQPPPTHSSHVPPLPTLILTPLPPFPPATPQTWTPLHPPQPAPATSTGPSPASTAPAPSCWAPLAHTASRNASRTPSALRTSGRRRSIRYVFSHPTPCRSHVSL